MNTDPSHTFITSAYRIRRTHEGSYEAQWKDGKARDFVMDKLKELLVPSEISGVGKEAKYLIHYSRDLAVGEHELTYTHKLTVQILEL